VIFRPSFVFGRDGGVLPTFVRLARFAPVTPIIGSGQAAAAADLDRGSRPVLRARDRRAAATNRTFELGGPEAVSWNEFWERLKRVLGVRRPSVHVPSRPDAHAGDRDRAPSRRTRDARQLTMLELGDNVVTDPSAVETFKLPLVPLDEQLRRAT
jgi:uncharacterized protein YbjT (DUF2867 family)